MTGLTLVLNAAEGRLHIVLAQDARLVCAQDWDAPRRGTELLAPALEGIFSGLRLRYADLARIACVRGPGSFTGIRLVLATAAALARASGALLAGLEYMQVLALAVRGVPEEEAARIWILKHARRDAVYAQAFAPGRRDGLPRAASELALLSPRQCLHEMRVQAQNGLRLWVSGSALTRHEEFASLPEMARCVPDACPSPEDLLLLARHAVYGRQDIEALYVQHCDAVENLASIAARRGEDPAQAEERLAAFLAARPEAD